MDKRRDIFKGRTCKRPTAGCRWRRIRGRDWRRRHWARYGTAIGNVHRAERYRHQPRRWRRLRNQQLVTSFALGIGPNTIAISDGVLNGAIARPATYHICECTWVPQLRGSGWHGYKDSASDWQLQLRHRGPRSRGPESLLGVGTNVSAVAGHETGASDPSDYFNFAINLGSADDLSRHRGRCRQHG